MNKPAVNPALARIAAIKSRSGSGMGRSFDHIEQKDELDLSPLIPTQPVTEVIIASTPEPLPALEDDTDELQASWQRIQGAFIDDPREAVADAAGLVEHTGQLLAGALRQRQRQLRALWDRDGMPDGVDYADSGSPAGTVSSDAGRRAADGGADTEQLRLLIRRYRDLFNQLCRP